MAQIYPFRAWRYNPTAVRLDEVVTQPYDKITPAMQQAYYQKSPYNLVRVVLGLPELFDAEGDENVYTRAARDFRSWRQQGILTQEKTPAIFAYAQRFQVPGSSVLRERRGFIALGKLHDYDEGVVFRHEQTVARLKNDRWNLLKATRAHFGQILMLYSDPARSVDQILYDNTGPADAEVKDEFGVEHRIWRVTDPATIRLLASSMANKRLIIGDGHNRYETALAYSKEHAPAKPGRTESNVHQLPHPPYPEGVAMMTFINMDSDDLVLLPTYRVVSGLSGFDTAAFTKALTAFFAVTNLPVDEISNYLETLQKQQPGMAFVAITKSGALLLRANADAVAGPLADLPERLRGVDLSTLHTVVLERLLGLNAEKMREQCHVRYTRDAAEAVEQVRRGDADVAFLTNPVTLEQLREVAFAGEVMPQRATDFYPNLLSGLTIYALD